VPTRRSEDVLSRPTDPRRSELQFVRTTPSNVVNLNLSMRSLSNLRLNLRGNLVFGHRKINPSMSIVTLESAAASQIRQTREFDHLVHRRREYLGTDPGVRQLARSSVALPCESLSGFVMLIEPITHIRCDERGTDC
jgi:hypothetical protein